MYSLLTSLIRVIAQQKQGCEPDDCKDLDPIFQYLKKNSLFSPTQAQRSEG